MPATASERPRHPGSRLARLRPRFRWTARLRLTLLYGALFVVSGAALLLITYLLVASRDGEVRIVLGGEGRLPRTVDPEATHRAMRAHAEKQRDEQLRQLLTQSAIALGLMSAVSVALGWVTAGRVLRPVRTMADRARRISERNLHERLAVTGPDDELKDLGDTFDGLLGRLDLAFDAQKRFVANASHELRTPITLQRALIEVALADPAADGRSLRAVCRRVLAAGEHQERLIEALLTLARSQRGLERWEPVDLARAAAEALRSTGRPDSGAIRVERTLRPATAPGDPRLVERLVTNLLDNAIRHNCPGEPGDRGDQRDPEDCGRPAPGWVRVSTGTVDGVPVLRVVNSGPVIPHDRVDSLFQPFLRYEPRTGSPDGHGLGLSIVAAIATAHGAEVTARPGPEGGLDITVSFPPGPGRARPRPCPGPAS